MKHTPGPWEVKYTEHDVHFIMAYMGYTIARLFNGLPPGMVEANARLIAAAPELLEALQAMLAANPGCYDVCGYNESNGHPLSAYGVARQKANKAIAKALGEEETTCQS